MANNLPEHVTIDDVAKRAGVSTATVSRVINRNYGVSDELQQRVLSAITELGYQPDRAARRLRANSSEVLGIIIPDIQNPYFTSVVRSIEDVAYEHQMTVLLCNTDDHFEKQENYIRALLAERVAGMILVPTITSRLQSLELLQRSGTPVVLVDRLLDRLAFDSVVVDHYQGAYTAVQHLIDIGYQRIALIVGEQALFPGRERHRGYQQALADNGINYDSDLVRIDHFKIESGRQHARELLQAQNKPDAIFAASNLLTLGVLKAARELRLHIPEDIALVGFDDMPWASELNPSLTVVAQPAIEIGQEAFRLLLNRRCHPGRPVHTLTLQTSLIIRESCGAYLAKGDGEPD